VFILVKLFGPQARLAGKPEVRLEVDDAQATCGGVLRALADTEPAFLAASIGSSRLAVNHAFVAADHRITPDDEVALIGLIGGG